MIARQTLAVCRKAKHFFMSAVFPSRRGNKPARQRQRCAASSRKIPTFSFRRDNFTLLRARATRIHGTFTSLSLISSRGRSQMNVAKAAG
jgi:hypothetical protein